MKPSKQHFRSHIKSMIFCDAGFYKLCCSIALIFSHIHIFSGFFVLSVDYKIIIANFINQLNQLKQQYKSVWNIGNKHCMLPYNELS